jgi:hypothetical protein
MDRSTLLKLVRGTFRAQGGRMDGLDSAAPRDAVADPVVDVEAMGAAA